MIDGRTNDSTAIHGLGLMIWLDGQGFGRNTIGKLTKNSGKDLCVPLECSRKSNLKRTDYCQVVKMICSVDISPSPHQHVCLTIGSSTQRCGGRDGDDEWAKQHGLEFTKTYLTVLIYSVQNLPVEEINTEP